MHRYLPLALLLLFSCSGNQEKTDAPANTPSLILDRQPGSITFKVSDVKKSPYRFTEFEAREVFYHKAEKAIFICPVDSLHTMLVPSYYNAFADAIHQAYADHRPLRLSPDVIWLQLLQGFSIHVNNNYEQLKDQVFVSEDVKTIKIRDDKLIDKNPEDWGNLIFSYCDSVKKYTRNNIGDAALKQYSTTGKKEQIAFGVTLLESVKKGFKFEAKSLCGIPEITLEGTTADWEQLKKNANAFRKFGLENWINNLDPVLEQFINASKGEIDSVFWQRLYKTSMKYNEEYISGWMLKFFPYIKESGNLYNPDESKKFFLNPYTKDDDYCFSELSTENLPDGLATIEIEWDKMGNIIQLEAVAGFTAIEQDAKTLSLKPYISWYICAKNADKMPDDYFLQRRHPEEKRFEHQEFLYFTKPFDTLPLMPVYDSLNGSKNYTEGITKIKTRVRDAIEKKQGATSINQKIQVDAYLTWEGTLTAIKTDASPETDKIIRDVLRNLPGKWEIRKRQGKRGKPKYTNVRIRFTLEP